MSEIEEMQAKLAACEREIGKEIIGQRDVIRSVMLAVLSGGNVLLEGMPGLGKTRLVNTISHVLNLSFKRIQFTPGSDACRYYRNKYHGKRCGKLLFQI